MKGSAAATLGEAEEGVSDPRGAGVGQTDGSLHCGGGGDEPQASTGPRVAAESTPPAVQTYKAHWQERKKEKTYW